MVIALDRQHHQISTAFLPIKWVNAQIALPVTILRRAYVRPSVFFAPISISIAIFALLASRDIFYRMANVSTHQWATINIVRDIVEVSAQPVSKDTTSTTTSVRQSIPTVSNSTRMRVYAERVN
jgi:uncharacterized membrane protein